jgi:transposase-like protein
MARTPAPTNLLEAIRYLANAEIAFDFVLKMRWADGKVICPRCGTGETSFISTRRIWKRKGCRKQFSLKVGTIFEDSPLGFDKWPPAIWLIANSKNSISSRTRTGARCYSKVGVVHASPHPGCDGDRHLPEDERDHRGGRHLHRRENMHRDVHARKITGTGGVDKMIVQGVRNRDTNRVEAEVIPNVNWDF